MEITTRQYEDIIDQIKLARTEVAELKEIIKRIDAKVNPTIHATIKDVKEFEKQWNKSIPVTMIPK